MKIIPLFIRRSFALRLSLSIIGITTALFIVAIGFLFFRARTAVRKSAIQQATQVLNNTSQHVYAILDEVETATNNTSWLVLQNLNPDAITDISRTIIEQNPVIDGCSIAFEPNFFSDQGKYFSAYSNNDNGHIESEQEGSDEYNYFEMNWYKDPIRKGQACWIDPFYDDTPDGVNEKGLIASYCKPLVTNDGRTIGVISSDISHRKFIKALSQEQLYPHSYFVLIGESGNTIATGTVNANIEEISGARSMVLTKELQGTDWKVSIVCPENDIFKGYYQLAYIVGTIIVFGLLLLLIFCYIIVRRTVSPLQMLAAKTKDMADGRFDNTLPLSNRKDDIGRLQNSFSTMQKSISDYVSNLKDVQAELELRNEELSVAKSLAEESDHKKMAFIQNMSHQIRTPLNIINGFAQILRESHKQMSDEERTVLSRDIFHNGYVISTIIENWTMISSLEKYSNIECDDYVSSNTLCKEAINGVLLKDPQTVSVKFIASIPDIRIHTDKTSVLKILKELLHNADKFTQQGSITISCRQYDNNNICFSVADTGCGIKPEDQEKVFEQFLKLDEFKEGLGLGLFLCRRLARILGGDLILDTYFVGGAHFILKLPYK